MTEVIGVVEQGQIKLPPTVRLPEGVPVKVVWDEGNAIPREYLEREGEDWTEEDVRVDLEWAMRQGSPP